MQFCRSKILFKRVSFIIIEMSCKHPSLDGDIIILKLAETQTIHENEKRPICIK